MGMFSLATAVVTVILESELNKPDELPIPKPGNLPDNANLQSSTDNRLSVGVDQSTVNGDVNIVVESNTVNTKTIAVPKQITDVDQTVDTDPDTKEGGRDPLVFGKWHYDENSAARCQSEHRFDYDNDGFGENFAMKLWDPYSS